MESLHDAARQIAAHAPSSSYTPTAAGKTGRCNDRIGESCRSLGFAVWFAFDADGRVPSKPAMGTVVKAILFVAILVSALPLLAQEMIEPRPLPVPTAEQRAINQSIQPRNHCPPRYPDAAAEIQQEGWVLVEFTISTEGAPIDAFVLDSSPPNIFDASALQAMSRCRFEPKVVNGEPMELRGANVVFRFEL